MDINNTSPVSGFDFSSCLSDCSRCYVKEYAASIEIKINRVSYGCNTSQISNLGSQTFVTIDRLARLDQHSYRRASPTVKCKFGKK